MMNDINDVKPAVGQVIAVLTGVLHKPYVVRVIDRDGESAFVNSALIEIHGVTHWKEV